MIGSNLTKRLVWLGHRVAVVNNLWRGRIDYLLQDREPVIDMECDFHELDLVVSGMLDPLLPDADYVKWSARSGHVAKVVLRPSEVEDDDDREKAVEIHA